MVRACAEEDECWDFHRPCRHGVCSGSSRAYSVALTVSLWRRVQQTVSPLFLHLPRTPPSVHFQTLPQCTQLDCSGSPEGTWTCQAEGQTANYLLSMSWVGRDPRMLSSCPNECVGEHRWKPFYTVLFTYPHLILHSVLSASSPLTRFVLRYSIVSVHAGSPAHTHIHTPPPLSFPGNA